jgi:hypothetical protein
MTNANSRALLGSAHWHAMLNGGGTYAYSFTERTYEPVTPAYGYWVAKPYGMENIPPSVLSIDVLGHWVGEKGGWHPSEGFYLGLWQDERGNWSVDSVEFVQDRIAAIARGRRNNQRAIWDIANEAEIKTGE